MKIGENIRRVREEAGITQVELAAIIGVKQSVISNWENGTTPHAARIPAIAAALGVRVEQLYAA